jgi:hypothetical protein
MTAVNSNESYCTFTLASDVTAGGLPSEADIAKDLESSDENVSGYWVIESAATSYRPQKIIGSRKIQCDG